MSVVYTDVVKAMLSFALRDELFKEHKIGTDYTMDGKSGWKLSYYPIFQCGKTLEFYAEPRALVEKPIKGGTDFREVPLRYLSPTFNNETENIG